MLHEAPISAPMDDAVDVKFGLGEVHLDGLVSGIRQFRPQHDHPVVQVLEPFERDLIVDARDDEVVVVRRGRNLSTTLRHRRSRFTEQCLRFSLSRVD